MGILISSFDFSPVAEDEFHDWYDTEHIPERRRVPGFLQCRRWLAVDQRKVSLTAYELASVDVLRTPAYLAIGYDNNSAWTRRVGWRCIKRLRFEGEQLAPGYRLAPERARALMVLAANVAAEAEEEFARSCERHHLPSVSAVAGVQCARLFRATQSTHKYVVTYHLDEPGVTRTLAWRRATEDYWAGRFRSSLRDCLHTSCVRYERRQTATGAISCP